MARRPGRTTLALALAILFLVLFGMARVTAPVSALGLLFDEPLGFAIAAAVTSVAGAVLLFNPRVELAVIGAMAGASREASDAELARLGTLLRSVGERAGFTTDRLVLRVQEDSGINAAAGGGHLLFVTSGALALSDDELEAILAHELGHHRGLHPVLTAVVAWLRLPGVGLAAVYGLLRRAVSVVGGAFGALGRLLALPLLLLLAIWQVAVMWVYYAGELLAMRAARISEHEADAAAARWGYAEPLARLYEVLAPRQAQRSGHLARLMADHPPLAERIERLRAAPVRPAARAPLR